MAWQVQEAKQRFSALVQEAIDEGPQIVTRHGEAVVVVMAIDEYERLRGQRLPFNEFLLSAPDLSELEIERDRSLPREVEL
jgi:prevent-host-death family protein